MIRARHPFRERSRLRWSQSRLRRSCEALEQPLHPEHTGEITGEVMIAAPLPIAYLEPPRREAIASTGAAQVNDRGQILLLCQRNSADSTPRQDLGNPSVEIGRRELDRVTRHDA